MSQRFSREFVDYVASLSIQDEYRNTFGSDLPRGKFFCPWHYNVNTPAAKVYNNRIKCFSCNKSYSTFDLLRDFNPERLTELQKKVTPPPAIDPPKRARRLSYPKLSELDLSSGITVELLNTIANYGKEKARENKVCR